ncbi:hypothetical protein [Saliphagus infecundisoli]|uniref:Uncharacterized protein n=1 Tax=Saliphagus infecundisoli TaxID=1849069 RepID=A0ABD5QAL2_9EURY|nr:hypothetical protein [Saliphagus infecundisoli]
MASATDENVSPQRRFLYRKLKVLRGSLLLSTVAIGVVLLLVAAIFESGLTITRNDGVLAGMFGVFGISTILAGGTFYLLLKAIHRS